MAGCSTVTVKVLRCFALWCALLEASAQARTLSRLHRRHHDLEPKRSSDEVPDYSIGFHEAANHHQAGRHQRHHDHHRFEDVDQDVSLDQEARRLLEDQERYLEKLLVLSARQSHPVRKRHDSGHPRHRQVARGSGHARYIKWDDSHMDVFRKGYGAHDPSDPNSGEYEIDVKEAQNSSLCNYTLEAIPDLSEDRSRTPKDLVNVRCNNLGSTCPFVAANNHCCIETYSIIGTSYSNGTHQAVKVYTGCVCSSREPANLKSAPPKKPQLY